MLVYCPSPLPSSSSFSCFLLYFLSLGAVSSVGSNQKPPLRPTTLALPSEWRRPLVRAAVEALAVPRHGPTVTASAAAAADQPPVVETVAAEFSRQDAADVALGPEPPSSPCLRRSLCSTTRNCCPRPRAHFRPRPRRKQQQQSGVLATCPLAGRRATVSEGRLHRNPPHVPVLAWPQFLLGADAAAQTVAPVADALLVAAAAAAAACVLTGAPAPAAPRRNERGCIHALAPGFCPWGSCFRDCSPCRRSRGWCLLVPTATAVGRGARSGHHYSASPSSHHWPRPGRGGDR
mmetsp:Transcript_41487/g.81557  ORF Transcript_41487/g.81557 Transcript_41487/m.81557 type:complete len:291 (-) Transcript_41487:47-919(-)